MLTVLSRNWWALALRGLIAILFGLLALVWPGITLFVLVILFGSYCLVDGVFAIVAAIRAAEAHTRWAQLLIMGIFGIIIAAITFFYPGITALALLYVIAVWAIVTGVLELLAGFELRRHLSDEILWILAGLASIAFGVILFLRPLSGALAVIWLIGIYAIVFGVLLLGLAFRLRAHPTARTLA